MTSTRSSVLFLACAAWAASGLTVDARDTEAHSVRIRGDRIVAVDGPVLRREKCVVVDDLAGRTVVQAVGG